MAYTLVFWSLGLVFAVLAAGNSTLAILFVWPSLAFLLAGSAYAGVGPRVFGKHSNGTIRPLNLVMILPFLVFTWITWHLARMVDRQPPWHEITPDMFAGRRVFQHELPEKLDLIVDLTAEFAEPVTVRAACLYKSLPILDASTADLTAFTDTVRFVAGQSGRIYIHCAQGHGRTGMFVAAVMIARGLANEPTDALRLIRSIRPGVRLKPRQWAFLKAVANDLRSAEMIVPAALTEH